MVEITHQKCACADCVCIVEVKNAVKKSDRAYCSETCADGHPSGAGCNHAGCGCHGQITRIPAVPAEERAAPPSFDGIAAPNHESPSRALASAASELWTSPTNTYCLNQYRLLCRMLLSA